MSIDFTVTGDIPKDQIQRAIDLSHEKYCSVWHSMRQDITFTTKFSVGTALGRSARTRRGRCEPGARTYLDVLRGVAVLIMIEAHVIDSWTRVADRRSRAFGESMILGGFGAPLFLFLAGVAVAMSAGIEGAAHRRQRAAMRAVQRRGLRDLRCSRSCSACSRSS